MFNALQVDSFSKLPNVHCKNIIQGFYNKKKVSLICNGCVVNNEPIKNLPNMLAGDLLIDNMLQNASLNIASNILVQNCLWQVLDVRVFQPYCNKKLSF